MSNPIKNLRRRAFQKREKILRGAIHDALGMLMSIPDESGKVADVGAMLADALAKEAAVEIPDPRPLR